MSMRKHLCGDPERERIFMAARYEQWQACLIDGQTFSGCRVVCCNICGEHVDRDEKWHESHDPSKPKCYGGKSVGVAHAHCNLRHGREVVVPNMAKADRVRAKHLGLKRPGMGRHPMRAGRRSRESKSMGKAGIVTRTTLAQKHAAMLARLYGARSPSPEV